MRYHVNALLEGYIDGAAYWYWRWSDGGRTEISAALDVLALEAMVEGA